MKYLFIFNPNSGPKKDSSEMVKKVIKRVEEEGHEVKIIETKEEGHGEQEAHKYLDSDFDVFVAIGGDGTVNEIARALVGSDKTLGIIPNGSGNGLARELNIPMDPKRATETLLRNYNYTIDTCKANGEPFFVTCGMGFDGKVSKEFASSDLRGLSTYARESITQFFKYEPAVYHIQIDDREVTATAFIVAVANASQYGNNAFIAPNASMVDGLLDLTVIKEFNDVDAPKIILQLFNKELKKNEYTSMHRGKAITISVNRPVNYHIDGEPKDAITKLHVEVVPSSLHVIGGRENDREKTVFDFFKGITNSFHDFTEEILGLRK